MTVDTDIETGDARIFFRQAFQLPIDTVTVQDDA